MVRVPDAVDGFHVATEVLDVLHKPRRLGLGLLVVGGLGWVLLEIPIVEVLLQPWRLGLLGVFVYDLPLLWGKVGEMAGRMRTFI